MSNYYESGCSAAHRTDFINRRLAERACFDKTICRRGGVRLNRTIRKVWRLNIIVRRSLGDYFLVREEFRT